MKQIFRFFAVLLLAAFAGTSAQATDWNIPEPQPSAFVAGDTFAVRNVGMQMFIYSGEAWGTQATVNSLGQDAFAQGQYYLVRPVAETDATFGEGYILYDNCKGWGSHRIWRQPDDANIGSGIKGCFVDNGGNFGAACYLWTITEVGTNKYTISTPSTVTEEANLQNNDLAYVEGEVLGVQTDHASSWAASNAEGVTYGLYYDVVYADAPANCQWEFINKKDIDIYDAKVALAELVDQAAELGLDVAAATALVNNPNATLDELVATKNELFQKLQELNQYDFPKEITADYFTTNNPYKGSSAGWVVTDADGKPAEIGTSSKEGDLYIGEFWSAAGYKLATTLHLPAGVYQLRAIALTRTDMKSTLAVGDAKTQLATVPSSEVNSRSAAAAWFNQGNGQNDLTWIQAEEDDVEVSITSDATTGDHWTVWRTFHLYDRGSNLTSYQKAIADFCAVDWEPEFADAAFTQSYYDAVAAAYAAAANTPSTEAEALNQYKAIINALRDLRENVDLYNQLSKLLNTDGDIYTNPKFSTDLTSFDVFAEVWGEVYAIFEANLYELTNEELKELIDRYNTARANHLDDISNSPIIGKEVDVLVNPKFRSDAGTSSFEGWTVASSSTFENNAGSIPVVEQWNGGSGLGVIDVYQMVNIKYTGAYRLTTKGWYRSTTNKDTHDNTEGYQDVNTYLYAAASQYKFHDIYDHPYTTDDKEKYFPNGNSYSDNDGYVYPNNCTGANELFNNENVDWYDMEADFLAFGEPVKLGVKGDNIPGYAWLIWDKMQVIYLGDTPDVMRPIAQYAADDAIQYTEGKMAESTRDNLLACIDGISKGDTKAAILDAYKNIGAAVEAAKASIANYVKLDRYITLLEKAIDKYGETASAEAYDAADAAYAKYTAGYSDGSIDDVDIEDALADIQKVIDDLKIPANIDQATAENPVELTSLITNPTYFDELDLVATWEGWTDADGNFAAQGNAVLNCNDEIGYAEGWNTSFDLYQDLTNMPEGTYRVVVNGLFRQGGAATDLAITQHEIAESLGKLDQLNETTEVPARDRRAKFYANSDSIPFHDYAFVASFTEADKIAFGSSAESGDIEYIDSISGSAPAYYYFPNVRSSLYERSKSGYYENEFYTYVDESGKLRIGACNKTAQANDWAPFSNWRLFYEGKNSPNSEKTGIDELKNETLNIESIYGIDGRRTNKLQKGLNIVVSNGKAKKVLVK